MRRCTGNVREPASITTSLIAAFAGAIALTVVLAATGGTHRLGVDLVAYAALAAATGAWGRVPAIPLTSVMYWLFYAGFLVGRHGTVQWHGAIDGWRLAMIAAAGLGAAFVAWIWRLVSPAPVAGLRIPDSPAELFDPDLPAAPVPHRG